MKVHFSKEQDYARFPEAVEQGIAAAECGEFVEPGEVWANVEKILQAQCGCALCRRADVPVRARPPGRAYPTK